MRALHPKIKFLFTGCVGACSEDSLELFNTRERVLEQQGPNLTRMFFLPGDSHGPTGWDLQAGADTLDLLVIFAINAFQSQRVPTHPTVGQRLFSKAKAFPGGTPPVISCSLWAGGKSRGTHMAKLLLLLPACAPAKLPGPDKGSCILFS